MKKLSIFLKSMCLGALFVSPLSVTAQKSSLLKASFDEIMSWADYYLLLKFTSSSAQVKREEILIEDFSKIREGTIGDYPELVNKLLSHTYYTTDLATRNNAFVHRLLDHYAPGSEAYEELTQLQVDLLKHLQIMEDIYQGRIDCSEDESDNQGYSPTLEQEAKDEAEGDYLFVINYQS